MSSNDLSLDVLRQDIEHQLDLYLPAQSAIAQPVVDAMRYAVLGGGKRIRPMLACLTCEAFGVDRTLAYPAGSAVEFIHAYSLIHDDLPAMDDDDIRHGQPAAHVEFGEANAILAGDSLHSLAFQTIAGAQEHDDATRLEMIVLLAAAAGWAGMAGGQCLDIAAEKMDLSLSQLQVLHGAKTGALIRVAIQLGVLSASRVGPSEEQMLLLSEFGDRIGLAFQVIDDILDVTQSTEALGKPAGSDVERNKNTFPKLMGVEQARAMALTLVEEAMAILPRVRIQTGGLEAVARMVVERSS